MIILFCIAKTLLDYRNEFFYSQSDIAKKLNITQAMVSKIESGKYNFSIKFLVNLWNKLSTENFNFSEIALNNMLKKSKKNYDIKYNKNVYSMSLTEKNTNVIKLFKNSNKDNKNYKSYNKTIIQNDEYYSSVI